MQKFVEHYDSTQEECQNLLGKFNDSFDELKKPSVSYKGEASISEKYSNLNEKYAKMIELASLFFDKKGGELIKPFFRLFDKLKNNNNKEILSLNLLINPLRSPQNLASQVSIIKKIKPFFDHPKYNDLQGIKEIITNIEKIIPPQEIITEIVIANAGRDKKSREDEASYRESVHYRGLFASRRPSDDNPDNQTDNYGNGNISIGPEK